MIEDLTPEIMALTMFLVVVTVPVLTLMISALLLWRYRRAVRIAMSEMSGKQDVDTTAENARLSTTAANPTSRHAHPSLLEKAMRGPWRIARRYIIAGTVFAFVFSVAAHFVYPSGLQLPGFLIAFWIYVWPVFLALPLIVPSNARSWISWSLFYLVVFALLGLWASTIHNLPEYRLGAITLPSRSSVTPEGMIRLWLAANGGPTLLMTLCFNRWVRAIAPLVLALVTTIVAGILATVLAIASKIGAENIYGISTALDMQVNWLILVVFLLSLAGVSPIGWAIAKWISHAYRRGRASDQSLTLDAVFLLFASSYTMWLVFGGLWWLLTAPAAFVGFKLAGLLIDRLTVGNSTSPPGLTFLRVFALGHRSEALLSSIAKYWRHVGSIQTITGPDLANTTVQPHQFLDFLSGKLRHHFVSDRESLDRALADTDRAADPDGRYRINNIYCYADSWQTVLPRLVLPGDIVLMDLRSFTSRNAGCAHEIKYLVDHVPFGNFVLVTDETTDESLLQDTLSAAFAELHPSSPNLRNSLEEIPRHSFEPGTEGLRKMVQHLALAATGSRRSP